MILIIILYIAKLISVIKCQCGSGIAQAECGRATGLSSQSHIGIPRACFNRPDPGPCAQDLIRIYYDHRTYQCKWFSFSGCGGNANRFVSIKNCYKLCHPYYRQRFITLNMPMNNEDNEKKGEDKDPPGDDDNAAGSKDSTTEEPDPAGEEENAAAGKDSSTTEEETTTTTTTEATTTEEFEPTGISFFGKGLADDLEEGDKGKVFFKRPDGSREEIEPEVHEVHEYAPGPHIGQHNQQNLRTYGQQGQQYNF